MGVTLNTILERSYRQFAGRTALVEGDHRLTYAELGDRVHRVANALMGLGLEAGDRVVLLSRNRAEFIVLEHALFVTGLVRVTPSILLHAKEVAYIANDCGARVLHRRGPPGGRRGCLDRHEERRARRRVGGTRR